MWNHYVCSQVIPIYMNTPVLKCGMNWPLTLKKRLIWMTLNPYWIPGMARSFKYIILLFMIYHVLIHKSLHCLILNHASLFSYEHFSCIFLCMYMYVQLCLYVYMLVCSTSLMASLTLMKHKTSFRCRASRSVKQSRCQVLSCMWVNLDTHTVTELSLNECMPLHSHLF